MNPVHYSSRSSEWGTPPEFFDALHAEFRFTVDVCASIENARIPFWPKEVDGLAQNWSGHVCWMNPPYGRTIGQWVEKAATSGAGLVVCLLPARTDTRWWHSWIWDAEHHRPRSGVEVRLLQGRLKFGGSENSAPFPSAVVIFRGQS